MHFFGIPGLLMFLTGLGMAMYLGARKIIALQTGASAMLVVDSPYFHIGLTVMILGTLLFISGYLGELISRNSADRNNYLIDEKI
jgi:hypothetical protein